MQFMWCQMEFDALVREIMRYTYPIYAGAALCLALLELLWYTRIAPTPIRLGRFAIYLLNALTVALLSISAGANPIAAIVVLRPYIALLRVVNTLVMVIAIWIMLQPLIHLAEKEGG